MCTKESSRRLVVRLGVHILPFLLAAIGAHFVLGGGSKGGVQCSPSGRTQFAEDSGSQTAREDTGESCPSPLGRGRGEQREGRGRGVTATG